jgi:hypothetical protein
MAKDVDEQFKCGNGTKSGYDAVMVVVCFVYIDIVVLVFVVILSFCFNSGHAELSSDDGVDRSVRIADECESVIGGDNGSRVAQGFRVIYSTK